MDRTAIYHYLEQRQGHDISDEDVEAYMLGFRDALSAVLADETYYGAHDGKPGRHSAVQAAVTFVETQPFEFPHQGDED